MDAAEVDGKRRIIAVIDVVLMNGMYHLLDAYRPVVVYAGLFCPFQIVVTAVLYPAQRRLVVVESDGTDGTCRVAGLASLGTGCV